MGQHSELQQSGAELIFSQLFDFYFCLLNLIRDHGACQDETEGWSYFLCKGRHHIINNRLIGIFLLVVKADKQES